jgi:hypothetical protein
VLGSANNPTQAKSRLESGTQNFLAGQLVPV